MTSRSARSLVALILVPATLFLLSGCGASAKDKTIDVGSKLYSFWPQFPAEPHVQFLAAYEFSSDIEPPPSGFDELIFGKDRQVLPISKPYGVEMWDGKIYVCDIRNPGVVVLDIRNQQTRMMVTRGVGGMVQPTDIAIADDGTKYIADLRRGAIFVFDASERHINTIGSAGLKPVGIAVHEDRLYVCDFETNSVQVLDRQTGETVGVIGEQGGEDGQFVRPLGIDVDQDGNVYVADVIKCRLQKFSPTGELLKAAGRISDTAGSFVRPKHLAVDRDGLVYIVDAAFDNVQVFNKDLEVLMFFGAGGSHPGAMNLPAGFCISDNDLDLYGADIHPGFEAERLLIVTNQFGAHKVAVYAMGQLREGVTAQDVASHVTEMRSGVQDENRTGENPLTDDIPQVQTEEPSEDDGDGQDENKNNEPTETEDGGSR